MTVLIPVFFMFQQVISHKDLHAYDAIIRPLCYCVLIISALIILRTFYLMLWIRKGKRSVSFKKYSNVKTAIVVGSGGHTAEIMRLVKHLDSKKFYPRLYVMASSDQTSENKIIELETSMSVENENWNSSYKIVKIPRSRSVGQSYVLSVFTTLYSILFTVPQVLCENPDLILCNGPGTCIPVCLTAFLMRVFFLSENIIIFVESICRVKSLSLSGKILLYFADEIVVQWTELINKYPRTKYIGKL